MSFTSGTPQHFEYTLHGFYTGESQASFISEWSTWASGYYPGSGVQLKASNNGVSGAVSRISGYLSSLVPRHGSGRASVKNHTGRFNHGSSRIQKHLSGSIHGISKISTGVTGSTGTSSGIATSGELNFYWSLSETGNANRVDSMQGLTLPALAGSTGIGLGTGVLGILGTGMRFNTATVEAGLNQSGTSILSYNTSLISGCSFWFWYKLVTSSTGTSETLAKLQFVDSSGFQESTLQVEVLASGHKMAVTHFGDSPGTHFSVTGTFNPTTGSWHMLAAVWDKINNQVKAYVDGSFITGMTDTTTNLSTNSGTFSIYNLGAASGDSYVCDIDEIGLCLHSPLNSGQVSGIWNGGTGLGWSGIRSFLVQCGSSVSGLRSSDAARLYPQIGSGTLDGLFTNQAAGFWSDNATMPSGYPYFGQDFASIHSTGSYIVSLYTSSLVPSLSYQGTYNFTKSDGKGTCPIGTYIFANQTAGYPSIFTTGVTTITITAL